MASANVYSQDGSKGSNIELNAAVFDIPENVPLVHQVVTALLANARQGNAETKTRSDVRGGGAKPFRQKGTGRARQGTSRSPIMRGGGTVFGPHKRSYRTSVPVKMRRKALCIALSDRARHGKVSVLDAFKLDTPRTRPVADLVGKLSPEGEKLLLVTAEADKNILVSVRNVDGLTVRTAADVNALDVLSARQVVFVQDALQSLEARLS